MPLPKSNVTKILMFIAFGILVFSTSYLISKLVIRAIGERKVIDPYEVHVLVNAYRVDNGLEPLDLNDTLCNAGEAKGRDMVSKGYFAHDSPDHKTPYDFIMGAGYRMKHGGENLAQGFLSSEGVVKGWINSPTHNDNLLQELYEDECITVVRNRGTGKIIVIQMFGTEK